VVVEEPEEFELVVQLVVVVEIPWAFLVLPPGQLGN